ncbi:tRNA (guanosine(37)-N1)-methyltransferase TrmD [Verticiella sediminum]|uniref:tRNA (guanine-N(1)-)-methyltransferase n=1 Tax=Verticiella sediminum TaxID=1247510 RepID=A0A556ACZ2_9BURK|nr:tRNA (guanosine(37)-N1)-methyltransferase TrmD [Verticiella sediminum]TSH90762.1 tRNA (guanosine(37)-N1)-methyltransferase TrmD [Verticiella sediminum]
MRFDIVTLFPEIFDAVTRHGVTARACQRGLWQMHAWNPREVTTDAHRTVDDRPYGGGPGMVMLADPLIKSVQRARAARAEAGALQAAPVILLSPTGRRFEQSMARDLASSEGAILICGRYEGVDQRFIDACVTDEWSLGDFVLSGGEIGALAIVDATVRLLPGALNHGQSAVQDSFDAALSGMLDCPHYTRPEVYEGQAVPAPLLSGHHAQIARWRREQSLRITAQRRPDLIAAARAAGTLSAQDERFLAERGLAPTED